MSSMRLCCRGNGAIRQTLEKPIHERHVTDRGVSRCPLGFTGKNFDDAIKPLLLLYIVASCVGTGVLLSMQCDGSRGFVLATLLHLLPEAVLWSHLIFPPSHHRHHDSSWKWRWGIRAVFALGALWLLVAPTNASGRMNLSGLGVYIGLASISDNLALYLGLVMPCCRSHQGARRLGLSFCLHGMGFQLAVYEFSAHGDAFGDPRLLGCGWFALVLISLVAFLQLVPLFRKPLDMRPHAPNAAERKFIGGGILASTFLWPLVSHGHAPTTSDLVALEHVFFLPQHPEVLTIYRVVSIIGGLLLIAHTLTVYVDEDLPILPR